MAYYGIPSAGIALTAGSDNDHIGVKGHGVGSMTAQTIFGGAGNDIINFGAEGITATIAGTISGAISGAGALSSTINGGPFDAVSIRTAISNPTGGAAVTTGSIVLTSVAPITTIDSAFIQANAGNDTISLGTTLTRITASQFKAGAGNDFIGFGNQFRDAFVTGTRALQVFKDSKVVGGAGNDTIHLAGAGLMTATEISAGAGNDSIKLDDQHIYSARIGFGGGNDILADGIDEIMTSTSRAAQVTTLFI